MLSGKKGFTLVELAVVLIIILSLAVIAAPVLIGARSRAITEEAMSGLAFLRVALKEYYFVNNTYQALNGDLTAGYPSGVQPGALNGRYFQDNCYGINNTTGQVFCYPHRSTDWRARNLSANNSDADYIRMDRDTGDLWQSGVPASGFKNE